MAGGLLAGAALGLSVAAPFGPVSLICVQRSLNRGWRYGLTSGLGAATAQGIFATSAITGAGAISIAMTPWAGPIRLLSALVLVLLGIRTILRARSPVRTVRDVSIGMAYASTLMLSLSNPMTIIPYLAVATVAAEEHIGTSASLLSLWSVPGVMLSSAAWYGCLSFGTASMRNGVSPSAARFLNFVAGGSLIVFGALLGRSLFSFGWP